MCKEPEDERVYDCDFLIKESSFYNNKDGGLLIALSPMETRVVLVPAKKREPMCIVRLATLV